MVARMDAGYGNAAVRHAADLTIDDIIEPAPGLAVEPGSAR
jgi:hypothetical protein